MHFSARRKEGFKNPARFALEQVVHGWFAARLAHRPNDKYPAGIPRKRSFAGTLRRNRKCYLTLPLGRL